MKKLTLLILALLLSALSAYADELYDKYKSAKEDLAFIEKSSSVTRKSYLNVADRFYEIYSKNPNNSLADDSLHYTAQTYYRSYKRFSTKDDLLKTLKFLKLLAVNYDTRLASMAYVQSADIYIAGRDYASARFMLNKLIYRFPDSEDIPTAKKKLEQIADLLKKEEKEIHVAASKKPNGRITATEPVLIQAPEPEPAASSSTVDTEDETAAATDSLYTDKQQAEASNGTYYGGTTDKDSDKVIKGIRHYAADDYTRVVIDLNKPTEFIKHWLKANPEYGKPPRLFIDVETDSISKEIPREIDIKDGLLRSVRWGINRPGVTRVVLDSDNVKDFTVFAMTNPDRIVIDVSNQEIDNKPAPVASTAKSLTTEKDLSKATLASVFGLKIRRIVIDPGHGGKDPGASYYGLKEKDIVLDVGLELEKLFKENTNLEVYMTRRTDVFIPLEERTAFANRKKADLFVSLHINASRNRNSTGIETYVLNVTKDKTALEVAAAENMATEKSMSDLQGILKDIMLNSKLEESLLLAAKAQEWLCKYVYGTSSHSNNRGVRQAPFYVLVGAQMPSILVEMGFISNKNDSQKFRTTAYKKKLAYGIYKGLESYIDMHK